MSLEEYAESIHPNTDAYCDRLGELSQKYDLTVVESKITNLLEKDVAEEYPNTGGRLIYDYNFHGFYCSGKEHES